MRCRRRSGVPCAVSATQWSSVCGVGIAEQLSESKLVRAAHPPLSFIKHSAHL